MTSAADVQQYLNSEIRLTLRPDPRYRRQKRIFDLVFGLCGLVASLPLVLVAAAAIWIEDRGTPFFSQERVGQYGRLFRIYKLRTMRLSACEDAVSPTSKTDARITRVGAFLRKTSLDELPQLFNVVRGDMAIVGPRPEMPFLVNRYEPWQHCRHLRKPGLTGLWQVSVRKRIPLHHPQASKIDLEYIRTASAKTDGKILLRTMSSLFGSGAY